MSAHPRLAELADHHSLPEGAADRLELLLELVASSPHSLTAVRDLDRAADLHVADSLTGLAFIDSATQRLADLGSGAGFPGLVLAVALPRTHVTLVESVGRKAAFLRDAIATLEVPNADVAACRAEEWAAGRETQDVVTARALAPLTTLVEYAAPLLRVGGMLVAWKGPAATVELDDAGAAARATGMAPALDRADITLQSVEGELPRTLYFSRKVTHTPARFPRRPGMARKRPITTSG